MAQITVSLPDEVAARLRRAASDQGYSSISAFIAEAVKAKLSGDQPLDYWTRVGLVVLLENNQLLASMAGKNWDYSRAHSVLTDGYEGDYDDLFVHVDKGGVSEAGTHFVIQVLAMYEDLQWSCTENKDDDLAQRTLFPGFDGNHETGLLGYTRHLVENQRFAHVRTRDQDYNSHGINPDYRTMLGRYKTIRENKGDRWKPLTAVEVKEVLER